MGGGAALAFSLAHPERVERLVLVDPYGIQKKAPAHRLSYILVKAPFIMNMSWQMMRANRGMTRAALRGIVADPQAITESLLDEVCQAVQDPGGQQAFYNFQRYEMQWNGVRTVYTDRLEEIDAPTLFIQGDADKLVPVEEIRRAVQEMPDARLVVMEKTGHWPAREHPAAFNRLLLDSLT